MPDKPIIPTGSATVIPSVHRLAALDRALEADAPAVLLTDAHIGNVHVLADRCHEAGKAILVRPDLMEGLRADKLGLTILAKDIGVDGICYQELKSLKQHWLRQNATLF